MLAGSQDHPIDRVFVKPQQARGGSHANSLGRVVDDLTYRLSRQMQPEQCTGPAGGKTLAAGAAVKQIAAFVLAILAANCNVALAAQSVFLALLVGTKTLFKLAHRLPPVS